MDNCLLDVMEGRKEINICMIIRVLKNIFCATLYIMHSALSKVRKNDLAPLTVMKWQPD